MKCSYLIWINKNVYFNHSHAWFRHAFEYNIDVEKSLCDVKFEQECQQIHNYLK